MSASPTPPTAAIVLIGDELLSGKIQDVNGALAIRDLRDLGVAVTEMHIVADEVERIVEAINLVRKRNDVVFTSGGIGPTHDDRTMEAVARAFDAKLRARAPLVELIERYYGDNPESPWFKMASIPDGCELIFHEDTRWPGYKMDNVYVLPGIPLVFARQFDDIKRRFTAAPFCLTTITFTCHEGIVATVLNEAAQRFADVSIGSYPVLHNPEYKVRVTVESLDDESTEEAVAWIVERFNQDTIVNVARSEQSPTLT